MTLRSEDAARFLAWMLDGVVAEGRGDHMATLPVAPKGRLWLGRLAPEIVVQNSRLGERSERLEPCEVGVRFRPAEVDGRTVTCRASVVAWGEFDGGDAPDAPRWRKTDRIEITAELPGLEEKDVQINVADNLLTIRGEKKAEKEEQDKNFRLVERSYGSFERTLELPDGVNADSIQANIAKGVLKVTVPKPAPAQAKKIEVKAAA